MAVKRWDSLPADEQADLEAAVGLTVAPEELASQPATRDHWQVVSREVETEDRLKTQRIWLFGERTRQIAMVLDFAHGTTPFDVSLTVGIRYDAELSFYPGHSLRAAVRGTPQGGDRIASPAGVASLSELLDSYSLALADCPWLERFAVPLRQVTPTRDEETWIMLDSAGESLRMAVGDAAIHTLLAISGGRPVDAVVEYDGSRLRPLTVVVEGRWVPLGSFVHEGA